MWRCWVDFDIIKRKAERSSNCRGCDKELVKGDDIIYTYSLRNRGQNIIFCMGCAVIIGNLAKGVESE